MPNPFQNGVALKDLTRGGIAKGNLHNFQRQGTKEMTPSGSGASSSGGGGGITQFRGRGGNSVRGSSTLRGEFPGRVLSRCCTFLWICGNKEHIAITKHVYHVINSANEMSILWRCSTNMEMFLEHCNAHKFLICAKTHLLRW